MRIDATWRGAAATEQGSKRAARIANSLGKTGNTTMVGLTRKPRYYTSKMTFPRFLLVWVLLPGVVLAQISKPRASVRMSIEAFGQARSEIFPVKAGDTVVVYPERGSDGTPAINSFVYGVDKVLIEKEGEEPADAFRWKAPADTKVYILSSNISEQAGTVVVDVFSAPAGTGSARATIPDAAVMTVYYATNRVATPGSEEPYGGDPAPGNKTEYGLCHVSIPRDHRMGELEGPSIWKLEFRPDVNKHIVIVGPPVVAGEADFFGELKQKIANSREKQALVFIHGFNTTFNNAARRTAQIAYDLGFDGVAAFYSWPSHGSLSPLGFNEDGRNADLTVAQFKQFLADLSAKTQAKTIHLIAHSMGNRVLTRALSEMSLAGAKTKFRQVILMAPDVDAVLFQQTRGWNAQPS